MTDRELLEAAAKAGGVDLVWDDYGDGVFRAPRHAANETSRFIGRIWWNPLTDDGDALRLAVKLDLLHTYSMDQVAAMAHFDATDTDPYAATRRAIVMAAAAVCEGSMSHDEFVLAFPGRFDDEEVARAAAAIGEAM